MKHYYMVLDSRASSDINSAAVLECLGNHRPSMKSLSKDWGQQGAVLVKYNQSGNELTNEEIVAVIP
ncbi:hypothetical protein GBL98_20790 [Yersinia pseudotuberculosis]|uniref:hypothetical protein n=1 Tax=Yersinia pseudotuberculosis TaxID=633 RepID=UPI000F4F5D60|nr:hypothetical protein [Yersinia pseudotuberculosis]AYX13995.1 hypothetical protein EGX44_01685 [Yersinia pseudotuberculosis]AYX15458.1 hypothetical protein EGX44_09785 [Yersinia pseudotuberculosis]MBO1609293.1 hypothetical protein [Yersinia pseudotuberculosis]MBO1613387.1 hypothetical protein [Yersinia pseudotuberculosis]MBO1623508.1 hypothetical protein [Yersinia pseudotuberculosis]